MKLPNNVLPDTSIHTRKWLNSISGLSIVMIMYWVSGCTSTVKFTPVDFCSQPINPTMARIIMSRTNSLYGAAIAVRVFDNGQPIGDVGPGGRLCWNRFPGKAVISKVAEDILDYPMSVKVEARANTTYHVRSSLTGQWELTTEPD